MNNTLEENGMKKGEKGDNVAIYRADTNTVEEVARIIRSDEEWRKLLSPVQFSVARKKGTEPPFSGKYHDCKIEGIYQCVCCGTDLFDSRTKFDSGTGWPSFWEPISELNIRTETDSSFGMIRREVLCSRCDAHLGHVFDDGPPPTGLRYCMNSASLRLVRQIRG
jgi:peptide-methionine (R)-S-oxide reductase